MIQGTQGFLILNIRISPAPGADYGEGRKARALDICSTKVKMCKASP